MANKSNLFIKQNLVTFLQLFRVLFFLYLFFSQNLLFSQNRYFVYLTDKNNSSYSLDNPSEFLSQRAIERRQKHNIDITERDFPVNQNYINEIESLGNKVWYSSKWFNALMLEATEAELANIHNLSFVEAGKTILLAENSLQEIPDTTLPNVEGSQYSVNIPKLESYGKSLSQLAMLGLHKMHEQQYLGENIWIAVLDAGFRNVQNIDAFHHLWQDNRIKDVFNFVNHSNNVFRRNGGAHGTEVLSILSAYKANNMIGSIPNANFLLYQSEDIGSEFKVEEANWIFAAEKADSAGVDIITCSLGYSSFDDESMNYAYANMDGKTALSTQAANFASTTGMLVVVSAGNKGLDEWQYITAPADAHSVLTVGAVDRIGMYAFFSSKGYTFDDRIKPNVVAQGIGTSIISSEGIVTVSNGTSFSTPIITGFVAGLWQANPHLSNYEIIDYVQRAGNQSEKPDSLLGYGIPSFSRAINILDLEDNLEKASFHLYPNPITAEQEMRVFLGEMYLGKKVYFEIYDQQGKQIIQKEIIQVEQREYTVPEIKKLTNGIYTLKVFTDKFQQSKKFIKL